MTVWLGKTDPEHLSIDDIEKAGITMWKTVRHPKAMQFMQQMTKGEKMLVYHSGGDKKIVGLVEIMNNNPDPEHPRGRIIKVKFVKKFSEPLVTLEAVKKSVKFKDFRLVWEPRLSVMDVPPKFLEHFKLKI